MVMQRLRKYSKLFLWIVVIGFVGWIFFDLGANLVGKRVTKPWQKGIIAEVNRHPVADRMFEQMYTLAYQDSVKSKGRELTDAESYALEEEVWKNLIQEIQWAELNQQRHLKLDDKTVVQIIRSSPPQQVLSDTTFRNQQGKFDYQKYLRVLQDPRNLPFFEQYERLLREQIPKDITRFDILFSIPVSKEDVWYEYKMKYQQVKVEGVGLYYRNIPDSLIKTSDEEIKKFYDENPDSFRVPPQVNLEYVYFSKSPSKDDTLEALERAKSALDEIKSGTSFEDAVSFYSEDASKSDSGDLGWIKKRTKWPIIFKKAQKLKKSEISEPFLSSYGWNIIKVLDKTPDSVHVKLILLQIRTSSSTRAAIKERAQAFYERAKTVGLDDAAKEIDKRVITTGYFSLNQNFVPGIGGDRTTLKFVREGKPGDLSPLIRHSWRYLIIQIKDKKPEYTLSFDDAKGKSKRILMLKKAHDILYSTADSILKRVKKGKSIKKAVRGFAYLKPKTFSSDWISRFDVIPGIGYMPKVVGAAFFLPKGKFSPPIETRSGIFIVRPLDIKNPNKKDVKGQLAEYIPRIRSFWADKLWKAWTDELVKEAKVKDYRRYILN